jgi:hypothetical protein
MTQIEADVKKKYEQEYNNKIEAREKHFFFAEYF